MEDVGPESPEPGLASEGSEYDETSSGKKVCSACRAINEAASVYCYKCGVRLPDKIQFGMTAGGSAAGFLSRFSAGFLDHILLITVGFVLFWIFARFLPGDVTGLDYTIFGWSLDEGDYTRVWWFLGILLVTEFIYFTVAISVWGRTVGKAVLGLRVVRSDGSRVSFTRSLARCLAYLIQLGLIGVLTFLIIAINPEKQGIHDMISDTRVVIT